VQDEPSLGGWQSGLLTVSGAQKPSYRAFALPLAEVSRRGDRVVLWGQVRPGRGARAYRLETFRAGRWVSLGSTGRTSASGTFERTVTLARGARVRIDAPAARETSPTLVLS
jgi:hypothetical protein